MAQRRREEEIQRGPGVIPNWGQGALGRDGISGNNGGGFLGTKIVMFFLAEEEVFLYRQDFPLPHKRLVCQVLEGNPAPNLIVWLLDLNSKVNLQHHPPIPLKIITFPHPTPIFFHPHLQTLAHSITYAPAMDCHQPHSLLMQTGQILIRVRRL